MVAASSSSNVCPSAGPGCHVARKDNTGDWVIEWESVDAGDYDVDEVPDIAMDPEERTLSLCNMDNNHSKVAYMTVFGTRLINAQGQLMEQGTTDDGNSGPLPCTTLIVLCPPGTFCHLCFIESLPNLNIESDVQVWKQHPDPADTADRAVSFPFRNSENEAFLCSQSENAVLTHFFAGNYHAVDFACPIGTEFVAVGNGTVLNVKTEHSKVTGISVQNMFQWNSLMLRLDSDMSEDARLDANDATITGDRIFRDASSLYVEYVHIDTVCVGVGDVVQVGQVLGRTGAAGFCPTPHLHLSAYRSSDDTAPTCRVYFRGMKNGNLFLPQAGTMYNENGPVDPAH